MSLDALPVGYFDEALRHLLQRVALVAPRMSEDPIFFSSA